MGYSWFPVFILGNRHEVCSPVYIMAVVDLCTYWSLSSCVFNIPTFSSPAVLLLIKRKKCCIDQLYYSIFGVLDERLYPRVINQQQNPTTIRVKTSKLTLVALHYNDKMSIPVQSKICWCSINLISGTELEQKCTTRLKKSAIPFPVEIISDRKHDTLLVNSYKQHETNIMLNGFLKSWSEHL